MRELWGLEEKGVDGNVGNTVELDVLHQSRTEAKRGTPSRDWSPALYHTLLTAETRLVVSRYDPTMLESNALCTCV